jgi:hypothetical protein
LQDAASEIVVPADHLTVHQHPLAILEVRRILLEHAAGVEQWIARPQAITHIGAQR